MSCPYSHLLKRSATKNMKHTNNTSILQWYNVMHFKKNLMTYTYGVELCSRYRVE